ncbi:MAG: hypothetical protein ACKPA7_13885, partial [Sphaerospermopsis kisseleviana]
FNTTRFLSSQDFLKVYHGFNTSSSETTQTKPIFAGLVQDITFRDFLLLLHTFEVLTSSFGRIKFSIF